MTAFFPYIHIPVFKWGSMQFDAFAILVAIGVVVGAMLSRRQTEERGLDLDITIDSFYWVLPGGFVISHIVDVVCYRPELVQKDPLILLYPWAGISSFGGILGGLLMAALFFYHRKLPARPYMDVLGWGLLVGFSIGRIGCAVAHDHPGLQVPQKLVNAAHIAVFQGKSFLLPGLQSPKFWVVAAVFALTAALLTAMIREKPLASAAPLTAAGITAGFFALLAPYFPAIVRSLAVPRPRYDSIFYKTYVPPMLIWGDVQLTINGKMHQIHTVMAYDLGLLEAIYCGMLILGGWFLFQGKPRREGFFLTAWFLTYPPVRILLDYLRLTDKTYAGFTPGQYMAMIMFVIGVYLYTTLPQRRWGEYLPEPSRPRTPPPATEPTSETSESPEK